MSSCKTLLDALRAGSHDQALAALYALDGGQDSLGRARDRACHVVQSFLEAFSPAEDAPAALFSGPGRTEIGGNHTDHQHGRVLCGSVDLDMLACAAPNGKPVIRIQSEGYPALEIGLDDLRPRKEEENTSAALVRGVAAKIKELGYPLSGFDACAVSTVLSGSGLSSSAAYETLVGNIFNHFCCGDKLDPVTIAKIGQYAENVYFGKPCGLMDQTASSVGGVVAIDFADTARPVVEAIALDLAAGGYALCILDSGADHADLTSEYASITQELAAVCGYFGKKVLREVPEEDFLANLPKVRAASGDRGTLRALHVYGENRRAAQEAQALREGDIPRFLHLVRESGRSSALYLQNVVPTGQREKQELLLTIALAERLLEGEGAVRVHGGGFGGTAQAFVPLKKLPAFQAGIEAGLGEGSCHVLSIRPVGGVRIG